MVLIKSHDETSTCSAFYNRKLVVATNRRETPLLRKIRNHSLSSVFGDERDLEMTYGIVDLEIQDLTDGQEKSSLIKRVWRAARQHRWISLDESGVFSPPLSKWSLRPPIA
jgi:hypothetical protein